VPYQEQDQQPQPPEWDLQFPDDQFPSWMVGNEFDVQALNTLMSSHLEPCAFNESAAPWIVMESGNDSLQSQGTRQQQRRHSVVRLLDDSSQPDFNRRPPKCTISEIWFTRVTRRIEGRQEPGTRMTSPRPPRNPTEAGETPEVDEVYRIHLSTQMEPKWSQEPFPSTEFLVSLGCSRIPNMVHCC
jgi:hypothetical protein